MAADTEGIGQLKKDFYETEIYLHKFLPLQSYRVVHEAIQAALQSAPVRMRLDAATYSQ